MLNENQINVLKDATIVFLSDKEELIRIYREEVFNKCQKIYEKAKKALGENFSIYMNEFYFYSNRDNNVLEEHKKYIEAVRYVFRELDFDIYANKIGVSPEVIIAIFSYFIYCDCRETSQESHAL